VSEDDRSKKYQYGYYFLDLRVSVPLTRHILRFAIPLPASTESDLRNPDKERLRADILAMRTQGMSYRQIARAVGLHWTRVQQIVKSTE
jgi:hypothetical protein